MSVNDSQWIHYMSHELVGLSREEFEANYCCGDPRTQDAGFVDAMRLLLDSGTGAKS